MRSVLLFHMRSETLLFLFSNNECEHVMLHGKDIPLRLYLHTFFPLRSSVFNKVHSFPLIELSLLVFKPSNNPTFRQGDCCSLRHLFIVRWPFLQSFGTSDRMGSRHECVVTMTHPTLISARNVYPSFWHMRQILRKICMRNSSFYIFSMRILPTLGSPFSL